MSVCSFKVSGQSFYPITGDNLFRQNFYGVGEHNYVLRTRIATIPQTPDVTLNTSAALDCGVWDGFIKLNNNATVPNNDLFIRPTSPNDPADYINGISTGDLVLLQRHILGIQPFTTGYQKVSADVNADNNITSADVTMLQQLIMGIRNDLTRNSWEWFHGQSVDQFSTSFFNNPYQFTLRATYPVVNGFGEWRIFNQTRPALLANLPYFRTTKVGDIGMLTGGIPNSWLCSTIPYFRDENESTQFRSSSHDPSLNQGDIIIAKVYLGNTSEVIGAELPIYIDPNKFKIESVELLNGFEAQYHYNAERKLLTFTYMDDRLKTLDISDTEVVKIKLSAKSNIDNPVRHLSWDMNRKAELIEADMTLSSAYVELRITDVLKSPLQLKAISDFEKVTARVTTADDIENGELTVTNIQGQVLSTMNVNVASGSHDLALPMVEKSGMYIATLRTGDKMVSHKFVIQN